MQKNIEPKIAVLKRFFLRLGDKEIDMGRDVRVIKDSQRYMVHLINHKAKVTLIRIENGEGIRKQTELKPKFISTWFLMTEAMKKEMKEHRISPPCGKCGLVMPFETEVKCKECTMIDGLTEVEPNGSKGELRFMNKKRPRLKLKRWTLNPPFTVKAYSKELFLAGENIPDLPMFIRRLLA